MQYHVMMWEPMLNFPKKFCGSALNWYLIIVLMSTSVLIMAWVSMKIQVSFARMQYVAEVSQI